MHPYYTHRHIHNEMYTKEHTHSPETPGTHTLSPSQLLCFADESVAWRCIKEGCININLRILGK